MKSLTDNSDKIVPRTIGYSSCFTGYIDHTANAAGGTVSHLGVFQGCEYVDSSTTGKPTFGATYWPGSGADSNHPVKAFTSMMTQMQLICYCNRCVLDK